MNDSHTKATQQDVWNIERRKSPHSLGHLVELSADLRLHREGTLDLQEFCGVLPLNSRMGVTIYYRIA